MKEELERAFIVQKGIILNMMHLEMTFRAFFSAVVLNKRRTTRAKNLAQQCQPKRRREVLQKQKVSFKPLLFA